jgi:hypothetical protein
VLVGDGSMVGPSVGVSVTVAVGIGVEVAAGVAASAISVAGSKMISCSVGFAPPTAEQAETKALKITMIVSNLTDRVFLIITLYSFNHFYELHSWLEDEGGLAGVAHDTPIFP